MKKKIIVTITVIMVMMISLMNTSVVEAKSKAPKMSKKSITIEVGASKTVKLKNAKAKKVKWSTSNKKIAKVSKGKITAQRTGKCKVTATYKNKKYVCKVTVKASSTTETTTEKKKRDKTEWKITEKATTEKTTENTTTNTTTEKVTPAPTTTEVPTTIETTTETLVETHTHSVDYMKTVWEYPEDMCHQPTIAHRYCSCGEWMYDEDMGIRGHKKYDYKEIVIEPTCTTEGYTECYCSDCGEFIYKCMETPAKGHTRKTTVNTESTCTTHGHYTAICSVCGEILSDYDRDLNPNGHRGYLEYTYHSTGGSLAIIHWCPDCHKVIQTYGFGAGSDPNPYKAGEYYPDLPNDSRVKLTSTARHPDYQ